MGIAYQSKTLSASEKLNNAGTQEITLANDSATTYHLGVKDTTYQKHECTLTAKLSWEGANSSYMDGVKVKFEGGQLQENNKVVGQEVVEVGSNAAEVMKSDRTKTQNGVYDYGFTSAKLVISSVEEVPAGTYNGNVDWNLSLTPNVNKGN